MKKTIFFCILLICVILIGCTDVQPDIVSIEYDSGTENFVITLGGNNRNEEETVKSLMTITAGSFTGTVINFDFDDYSDSDEEIILRI